MSVTDKDREKAREIILSVKPNHTLMDDVETIAEAIAEEREKALKHKTKLITECKEQWIEECARVAEKNKKGKTPEQLGVNAEYNQGCDDVASLIRKRGSHE